MNFILGFLVIMSISFSMTLQSNGILAQATTAKTENQLSTVEEQVQMAVFAQISQYLQNNVLTEGNAGAEGLVDDIVVAVGDKSSKLCTSLPEVYGEPTKATFTVIVDGTTYKATFDGITQSTTVVAE